MDGRRTTVGARLPNLRSEPNTPTTKKCGSFIIPKGFLRTFIKQRKAWKTVCRDLARRRWSYTDGGIVYRP
jgi:hypothetical protein